MQGMQSNCSPQMEGDQSKPQGRRSVTTDIVTESPAEIWPGLPVKTAELLERIAARLVQPSEDPDVARINLVLVRADLATVWLAAQRDAGRIVSAILTPDDPALPEAPAEPETEPEAAADEHLHGFRFVPGLGYLPTDENCTGCCKAATAAFEADPMRAARPVEPGDVPGEVVHCTAISGDAVGWHWSCTCGDGDIDLATEEFAQIEAREHLDEVNARVFTAKPERAEAAKPSEAPSLLVPTSMLDEDPAPGEHVYVGGEVSNTGCAAECWCGERVEGHVSLDAAIEALRKHIDEPQEPAAEAGVADEAKSEHQAYVFPSGRWFGWTCSCQEDAGGYDSWVAAEEALGRHAFETAESPVEAGVADESGTAVA